MTHDGRLTISGDRHPPPFLSNTDPALPIYPVKELKYGRFERTINVPPGLEVYFPEARALTILTLTRLNLGQRHKRILGRWHAQCFLATNRPPGAVPGTDAACSYGVDSSGPLCVVSSSPVATPGEDTVFEVRNYSDPAFTECFVQVVLSHV